MNKHARYLGRRSEGLFLEAYQDLTAVRLLVFQLVFSARCNIYISRLCYDASVRLSVRLSVTEVHWRIIANLDFKFRSHFTAHCGRRAAGGRRAQWRRAARRAACGRISRAMLASARLSCSCSVKQLSRSGNHAPIFASTIFRIFIEE